MGLGAESHKLARLTPAVRVVGVSLAVNRYWRQGFGFGGLLFVPGREIKQAPLDKWIGTACEVAEQIGPLFVKLIFKHGLVIVQVGFDRHVAYKITGLLGRSQW
jgi:hypothetical protein